MDSKNIFPEKLLLSTTSNNINLEQIRTARSPSKRHLLTQEDIESAKNKGRK
jgi:hypothetical protein